MLEYVKRNGGAYGCRRFFLLNKKRSDPFQSTLPEWGETFCMVMLINVFGFLFAVILTREIRGSGFFGTVLFMPDLIGGIALGYIWQIIINYVLL